jgi:hypothetical protein
VTLYIVLLKLESISLGLLLFDCVALVVGSIVFLDILYLPQTLLAGWVLNNNLLFFGNICLSKKSFVHKEGIPIITTLVMIFSV